MPETNASPVPQFDLDFADLGEKSFFVGDSLHLKVSPKEVPLKDVQVDFEGGQEALRKEGWALKLKEKATENADTSLFFDVVPLRSGTLTLPSLTLKQGEQVLGKTTPLSLKIGSALEDKELKGEVRPLEAAGPASMGFPWASVAKIASISLLVGILAAVLISRYLKNKKARSLAVVPEPVVVPVVSPEEILLGVLAKIEKDGILDRGLFKAAYFEVSDALKAFISAKYELDAKEATTSELLELTRGALKIGKISDRKQQGLVDLFLELDPVKFSDAVPALDSAKKVLEKVRDWARW